MVVKNICDSGGDDAVALGQPITNGRIDQPERIIGVHIGTSGVKLLKLAILVIPSRFQPSK